MKLYAGITDTNWYNYLSRINPDDVNFWQPGGFSSFRVLKEPEPFLFKLRSPIHAIAGVGFFSSYTSLPLNMAWDVFKQHNGCETFQELKTRILSYRKDKENINPTIGCIVLNNPIFFRKLDWIPADDYMGKAGIVQGKSFDTSTPAGERLWAEVSNVLQKYQPEALGAAIQENSIVDDSWAGYGKSILQKVRVGQGAFRMLITDAYHRKCSISGEKTLPVLEAAHIKPYALQGTHIVSNGLLLRSDMHKLFDNGYLTVTPEYKVEVSKSIKEEFENGKEYYQYHGKSLLYLPESMKEKPNVDSLRWHNENVYKN